MTAIFGVFSSSPVGEQNEMENRLLHRGKYSEKLILDDHAWVGCRTPKKIDSICQYHDVTVCVVGEIFNINELRSQINHSDTKLGSNSNSNLVLLFYLKFGLKKFFLFEGNFAFFLWDSFKKNLILCRDYFGLQPVYYTILGNKGIAFASEYKSLLALTDIDRSIDLDMVQCLQYTKKLPSNRTLFKHIHGIESGAATCFALKNLDGITITAEKFPPLVLNISSKSEEEICEELVQKLTLSIQRRVQENETIGIALSGGIDSIGIAYLTRKLFPDHEIHTFSAGHGNQDFDLLTAKQVASEINSSHHEIPTPPSLIRERLHQLVWHMEDPITRSEALQLFEMGKCAKDYVISLISGQGADSLYGGMPRYKILWYIKKFPFLKGPFLDIYLYTQNSSAPHTVLGNILKKLYFRGSIPDPPLVLGSNYTNVRKSFPTVGAEFINEILVKGFQSGQSQEIPKFERNFSAHGIIYKAPFYDLPLVNQAFTISDILKIKRKSRKYILRQAFSSIVPKNFQNVPKIPQRMNYDLEFTNAINALVTEYLSEPKVKSRGFFSYKEIKKLISNSGDKPYSPEWGMRLWTALLTEVWAMEFIDNKGVGSFRE